MTNPLTVGQLRKALLMFDQDMPVATADEFSGIEFDPKLLVFKVDPLQPMNSRPVGSPIVHTSEIENRMIPVLVVR